MTYYVKILPIFLKLNEMTMQNSTEKMLGVLRKELIKENARQIGYMAKKLINVDYTEDEGIALAEKWSKKDFSWESRYPQQSEVDENKSKNSIVDLVLVSEKPSLQQLKLKKLETIEEEKDGDEDDDSVNLDRSPTGIARKW